MVKTLLSGLAFPGNYQAYFMKQNSAGVSMRNPGLTLEHLKDPESICIRSLTYPVVLRS